MNFGKPCFCCVHQKRTAESLIFPWHSPVAAICILVHQHWRVVIRPYVGYLHVTLDGSCGGSVIGDHCLGLDMQMLLRHDGNEKRPWQALSFPRFCVAPGDSAKAAETFCL